MLPAELSALGKVHATFWKLELFATDRVAADEKQKMKVC
jgi:hypothetical protein